MVVHKYQQIPQSMISNNRSTIYQLDNSKAGSGGASGQDAPSQGDNDRGMPQGRSNFQDENYRSSPGLKHDKKGTKSSAVVKSSHLKLNDDQPGPKQYKVEDKYSKTYHVSKMPNSPVRPKTKISFENKI